VSVTSIIRSTKQLHPLIQKDLLTVVPKLHNLGFRIYETDRTPERQAYLHTIGSSRIKTLGYHSFQLALDIVRWSESKKRWMWDYDTKTWGVDHWKYWKPSWYAVAGMMKDLGYEWGGDWKSFKDYPHFQESFGMRLVSLRIGKLPDTGHEDWGLKIRKRLNLT